MSANVVVLAGGTGGAKLARGLQDEVGSELTVIANTADDIEIYGGYVSPDPDLITFWLADRIDERGWGLRDDTFTVMDMLRELGEDVWFSLGDRDLGLCLWRAQQLAEGVRVTEAIDTARKRFEVPARVLPMCDDPVRTWVRTDSTWVPFQEFMIKRLQAAPELKPPANGSQPGIGSAKLSGVEFRGARQASPTPEVLDAIANARAIVIGPSNPIISIGPILAIPGIQTAIKEGSAPVVAVSPIVGGKILKGPTELFLSQAGVDLSADGIASFYEILIDGLISDEESHLVPTLQTDVGMPDDQSRRRVARETLRFAESLTSIDQEL